MSADASTGERLKLVEERRKASEGVLWQLPAVSLAAQAFLLAAGLNPDADNWARIIAGSLGIVSVLATAAVLIFQGVRLSILVRWVDQTLNTTLDERVLAGELRGDHDLKPHQKRLLGFPRERVSTDKRHGGLSANRQKGLRVPNPYVSWVLLLLCFLAGDVYVLVRGIVG